MYQFVGCRREHPQRKQTQERPPYYSENGEGGLEDSAQELGQEGHRQTHETVHQGNYLRFNTRIFLRQRFLRYHFVQRLQININ